jgi:5'(3')-deoxyribonucleotidase
MINGISAADNTTNTNINSNTLNTTAQVNTSNATIQTDTSLEITNNQNTDYQENNNLNTDYSSKLISSADNTQNIGSNLKTLSLTSEQTQALTEISDKNNIYVSTTGSNTATGTQADPTDWTTAYSNIIDGGTIYFTSGTYNIINQNIAKNITLSSYNGNVILDANKNGLHIHII